MFATATATATADPTWPGSLTSNAQHWPRTSSRGSRAALPDTPAGPSQMSSCSRTLVPSGYRIT